MKTEDIFEALTDIDDKFIAAAHPSDLNDDQPVVVRPMPRKPVWKTLVPAAACIAVIGAAGVFGARFITNYMRPEAETASSSDGDMFGDNNSSLLKIEIPRDGSETQFKMGEFSDFVFSASVRGVKGVQKTASGEERTYKLFGNGFDFNVIYLADLNGDGRREICAAASDTMDQACVLVNDFADGIRDKISGSLYYEESDGVPIDGRIYSLFANGVKFGYTLAEKDGMLEAVKFKDSEEISREPLALDIMKKKVADRPLREEDIPTSAGSKHEFTLEEFSDNKFTVAYNGVIMNGFFMNTVDLPLISADELINLFLTDLNDDGMRELCATVRNSGVDSVEVIDLVNGSCYKAQGDQGRSCYLKFEDKALKIVKEMSGGGTFDVLLEDQPLSLDSLTLTLYDSEPVKIGEAKQFAMEEFPELIFINENGTVFMSETSPYSMKKEVAEGVEYYLADLNGDGKRELCSWGHWGSGIDHSYIMVYDIENNETYSIGSTEEFIRLELTDRTLQAVTTNYDQTDSDAVSREPLTIEMLGKVEKPGYERVPLNVDQSFTLPDFEGFWFTVDTRAERPGFEFGWENKSVGNDPYQVYLCDLDGDGNREIVMNCPYSDIGCIKVYGFMEHGEFGEAVYFEEGGCRLAESDGTLVYEKRDGERRPFEFSKSDLVPNFLQMYYYEITDMDFTVDFTDILPWSGKYSFQISKKSLSVYSGDECVSSAQSALDELYVIPNRENGTLVFVYTYEDTANFGAIRVTEDSVDMIRFDTWYTLKPAGDSLYIVCKDGSEVPFRFSKEFAE